jgi:putative DNA primase/helicase
VRAMYRPHADAKLFCRLTYIANDAIPFDDTAQAMANRLNLLYFPNNYRKNNPDWGLEDKLRAEAPGIAMWAIEGLKRLLANGQFTRPKTSEEHMEDLAKLTNPIGAMLEECCVIHSGEKLMSYREPVTDLYDLWKRWADENRVRTNLTSIGFGSKILNMGLSILKRRAMEQGRRINVYQGLEITSEARQKYLMR